MVYKNVSAKSILARVYRDFNPSHSGWQADAMEWINDGLEEIGSHVAYELVTTDVTVEEFRTPIPCNVDAILGLEYQCFKLNRNDGINTQDNCQCLANLNTHPYHTYSLNPGYIRFSFEATKDDEKVKIHHISVPRDCDGFPMIPDEQYTKQALGWYIMRQLIARGYKHHTFNYADCDAKWTQLYPRAQNAINFPDLDGYERFKAMWSNPIIHPNWSEDFFNSPGGTGNINNVFGSVKSPLTIERDAEGNIIQ